MLGLQSELCELFNTKLAGTTNYSLPRGVISNGRDICIMVKVLQKEHLLKEITGIFHRNIGGFIFSMNFAKPAKFKDRILKHQHIQAKDRRKCLKKRQIESQNLCNSDNYNTCMN